MKELHSTLILVIDYYCRRHHFIIVQYFINNLFPRYFGYDWRNVRALYNDYGYLYYDMCYINVSHYYWLAVGKTTESTVRASERLIADDPEIFAEVLTRLVRVKYITRSCVGDYVHGRAPTLVHLCSGAAAIRPFHVMFSNPQLYPLVLSPTHNSNLVSRRGWPYGSFYLVFRARISLKRVREHEPRKVPVLRRWNLHIINSINVGGGEQKFRSNVYFSPSLDPTSQPLNRARYYRALLNIQRYARAGETENQRQKWEKN